MDNGTASDRTEPRGETSVADLPVAALELIRRGYSIFPCKPKDKVPATKNGFKDATKDPLITKQRWEVAPARNIGIACGASGVVVFDIDPKHGADPDEVIPNLNLPENTPIIRTGKAPPPSERFRDSLEGVRGAHAYLQGSIKPVVATVPGCEFRGDGSYIIAPPSIHPSGVAYEGDIPPVDELPKLPDHIRALAGAAPRQRADTGDRISSGRHEALLSLMGTVRDRGAGFEELVDYAQSVNRNRIEPKNYIKREWIERNARYLTRKEPKRTPARSGNDRTHRTPSQKPHGNAEKSVRSPTEHSPNTAEQPCPTPRDVRAALVRCHRFYGRFLVMLPAGRVFLAAWNVHTYLFDAAETTPYPSIRSPERESGKTRALEVANLIARDAEQVADVSISALFRAIEKFQSTILLDEVDAVFSGRDEDSKDLRRLLNAGYRRGAQVLRTVGDSHEPKRFPTFAPKLLAGIGGLPDTLESRCTPIPMHRKLASEDCERLRLRKVKPEADALVDDLLKLDHPALIEVLASAEPSLPDELGDREQDCAEPLLAIADYAGGVWPAKVRAALVELHGGKSIQDESVTARLLFDIKEVFGGQDRLSTKELLAGLCGLEEAPWGDWFGKPLTANKLASMLHDYGIRSKGVRIGDKTPKGYLRKDFDALWERYSPAPVTPEGPESASQSATPQHRHEQAENGGFENATDEDVLRFEKPEKPHEQTNVAALRHRSPNPGSGEKPGPASATGNRAHIARVEEIRERQTRWPEPEEGDTEARAMGLPTYDNEDGPR